MLISCNSVYDKAISLGVDIANKECPMQLDEVTTLENVEYIKGVSVNYNNTINETWLSMSFIEENIDLFAESIVEDLTSGDPDLEEFIEACKNRNVVIIYNYRGSESGRTCSITYNPNTKTTSTGK